MATFFPPVISPNPGNFQGDVFQGGVAARSRHNHWLESTYQVNDPNLEDISLDSWGGMNGHCCLQPRDLNSVSWVSKHVWPDAERAFWNPHKYFKEI